MTHLSSLIARALAGLRPSALGPGDVTTLPLIVSLCRTADTFLDVGANVGLYASSVAAAHPECRVIAYEPTPHLAGRLRRHGGIEVVEAAVGARPGRATFYVSASDAESTLLASRAARLPGVTEVEVPVVTLDDELRRLGCEPARTVVKIDVEGAEEAVWAGMPALLRGEAEIVMEFLGLYLNRGAIEKAVAAGRKVYYLPPTGPFPLRSSSAFNAVQDIHAWNFWLTHR